MLLTKFGKNPTKHVEEEANCEKERKKEELDPVPFSRARGKLGVDILKFRVRCFIDF